MKDYIIDEEIPENLKYASSILSEIENLDRFECFFPALMEITEEMKYYIKKKFKLMIETMECSLCWLETDNIDQYLFISTFDFDKAIRFLLNCKQYCKGSYFEQVQKLIS